jgi:hypothetical protein
MKLERINSCGFQICQEVCGHQIFANVIRRKLNTLSGGSNANKDRKNSTTTFPWITGNLMLF